MGYAILSRIPMSRTLFDKLMPPFPRTGNPFHHEKHDREFEKGLVMILINRLPSMTARKACRARSWSERLSDIISKPSFISTVPSWFRIGKIPVFKTRSQLRTLGVLRLLIRLPYSSIQHLRPSGCCSACFNFLVLQKCRDEAESVVSEKNEANGVRKIVDISNV